MEELIVAIARGLVDDKDAVAVTRDEEVMEDGTVVYHLHVAQEDMGRVIGKQGRIAKAIRTVVRAAANKSGTKIAVEID
ncbi:MAG: KH domain-containing protein [Oscillospiraceae bacterium]|nr:KH domain-containing protein [Oscillospiraceae bacterium]